MDRNLIATVGVGVAIPAFLWNIGDGMGDLQARSARIEIGLENHLTNHIYETATAAVVDVPADECVNPGSNTRLGGLKDRTGTPSLSAPLAGACVARLGMVDWDHE